MEKPKLFHCLHDGISTTLEKIYNKVGPVSMLEFLALKEKLEKSTPQTTTGEHNIYQGFLMKKKE